MPLEQDNSNAGELAQAGDAATFQPTTAAPAAADAVPLPAAGATSPTASASGSPAGLSGHRQPGRMGWGQVIPGLCGTAACACLAGDTGTSAGAS